MKKLIYGLFALASLQLAGEDFTWYSPTTLSSTMNLSSDPCTGIDSNGNAEALWIENGVLTSSALPYGGSWSSPTAISNSGASEPYLAVDLNGNATAIWLEGSNLFANTKSFGGSWNTPTTLSSMNAATPNLAIDASGNVVAVWVEGGVVKSKTKLFGGSWPMAADTLSGMNASNPQVAIGANGTAATVWEGISGGINAIFAANKPMSGSWNSPTVISNVANPSVNPQIAVDSNGKAVAIWYIYTLSSNAYFDVYLQSSTRPSGGSWSLPILVAETTGYYDPNKLTSRIAFDSTGTAITVWSNSSDGSTFDIYSTILPTDGNGTWYSPEIGLVEKSTNALGFDISVPAALDAFLAYMINNGPSISIFSNISNIAAYQKNRWTSADIVAGDGINGFPKISAAISGNSIYAISAWLRSDENVAIDAAFGEGTVLQPPTDLIVMQSSNMYGIFTEYYNTITWNPSSSPEVISYLIFRDGLLIGEVLANVNSFIDNNREQNAAAVYGVATIDSKGTQSGVATVSFP